MSNASVLEGHPTNLLYVVIDDGLSDGVMHDFEEWLATLPSQRSWVIQSPELIDYFDENGSPGDSSHTYGCGLRMYSALPPWGEKLPKEVDLQHLQETEFLIEELVKLSKQSGCNFRLQFDRSPIGKIVDGELDEGITVGLLGEWRKAHAGYSRRDEPRNRSE